MPLKRAPWLLVFAAVFLSELVACGAPADPDGGVDCADPTAPGCAPSCAEDSCPASERCVAEPTGIRCECPPGSVRTATGCMEIVGCTDTTCDGHGLCMDEPAGSVCTCDPGYAGDRCEECAPGYARHAEGECVTNLCDPNPCDEVERRRCEVVDGAATCLCNAGTHDEGGVCVPDAECSATTCSMRGRCSDDSGVVTCECDAGTTGRFCEACDEMGGYHDDGMGGCTTDVCVPNPCTTALETVCAVDPMGNPQCECDPGAHREMGACVPDEVCDASTCAATGMCQVVDGRTQCVCDPGHAGPRCAACDAGYHPDGMGGCTTDPCLPNPCTAPNQTICRAVGMSTTCECDAGYHPDGVGGCTNDPCTPNPCAAMGQACRVSMGMAECYTPVCDDSNPCTDDAVVMGACVFTPRADGSPCSTTLCTSGQTCAMGTCGGGSAVTCDDGNPCTRDRCDASAGCSAVNDDTLVPDDGVACTDDACAAGVASHAPVDARCDDGLFCNGAESCDALMGCVTGAPPLPPGPSIPCRSYGACDEVTDAFPLTTLPSGASCDDGLACTTGDVCLMSGICAGTPMASCPTGACAATTAWSSGPVDVAIARLTGAVRVDGAPMPATLAAGFGSGFDVFLVNRETEQRHYIASPRYSGGALVAGSDAVDASLVPGVYDLLYSRGHNDGSASFWPYVNRQALPHELPNGYVLLQTGVVVGAGSQTLDVNVPVTRLTGTVQVEGMPMPATLAAGFGSGFDVFLVNRETEQRHYIASPRYSGGALVAGSDAVDASLVPGTYDLLYSRGHNDGSASFWPYVNRQALPHELPNGYVLLQSGIVLSAGAQTLNVNVPVTRLTGTVQLEGMAMPAALAAGFGSGFDVFLVNRETEQRHYIASPRYSGGALVAGSDAVDASLVPGTYDVLYSRGHNDGSASFWPYVNRQALPHELPNGYVLLQTGVVLAPGAQTLNVNVPVTRLTGTVQVEGMPMPAALAAGFGSGFDVFLVNRETEQRHYIASPRYSGGALVAGSDAVDASLVPGTYDVLYSRGHNDGSASFWPYVNRQALPHELPNGYVLLQSGIVLSAGAQTLNVNVPVTRLTGTVRVEGAAMPPMLAAGFGSGFDVFLVDVDTGQRHYIASPRYSGGALVAGSDAVDASLVPGTYDLLYSRGHNDGSETFWPYVNRQSLPHELPNGYTYLARSIVLAPGAQTLHVDVPVARLSQPVHVEGLPMPASLAAGFGSGFDLFFVDRQTGQRHYVASPRYSGGSLVAGSDVIDASVVPGTYDLLYSRGHNDGSDSFWPYVNRQALPHELGNGYALIAACRDVR